MTYISVAGLSRWPNLLAATLLCVAMAACNDGDSAPGGPGGSSGAGGNVPPGCALQNFLDEPDIFIFPLPARQAAPGSVVEFSIYVDKDTRLVKATFMGAYRLDPTASPQTPSETQMVPTAGDEMLDFAIQINTTGRYYVDLELCGIADCSELRVVYTLDRAFAGDQVGDPPVPGQPINNPYERIVYRNEQEASSSNTCDQPRSIAIQ